MGRCNLTTKDRGDNQQAYLVGNITARAEDNTKYFLFNNILSQASNQILNKNRRLNLHKHAYKI